MPFLPVLGCFGVVVGVLLQESKTVMRNWNKVTRDVRSPRELLVKVALFAQLLDIEIHQVEIFVDINDMPSKEGFILRAHGQVRDIDIKKNGIRLDAFDKISLDDTVHIFEFDKPVQVQFIYDPGAWR